MIDVHSHILFGIDDGSTSLEMSLEMLRMAAAHGTERIVATPHANLDYGFDPVKVAERWQALDAVNDTGVIVHLGTDFHLAYEFIEDALNNPRKYTIDGGSYLLVEFSDFNIPRTTSDIFASLMRVGMIPVITHPERNLLLQKRLDELRDWVGMGCGIQVTAQSLLGDFGSKARKFSETLFDEGLVHVVASDAHDLINRPPRLDRAWDCVEDQWGAETANLLFRANPAAILASENWAGTPAKRKRGLMSLFR
ncbi:MAG: tyrosine protein phosphatase [Bryobacter sp.]